MTENAIRNSGGTFLLSKGLRLKALRELRVLLPATILEPPGTPLAELVMLSDENAQIGVVESGSNPGKVSKFIIFMKPETEICLSKSSEAYLEGVPIGEAAFEILD